VTIFSVDTYTTYNPITCSFENEMYGQTLPQNFLFISCALCKNE